MSEWMPRNPHERTSQEMEVLHQAFHARGAHWMGTSGVLTHEQFQQHLNNLCVKALQHGEAWMLVNGFVFAVRRSDLLNTVAMV